LIDQELLEELDGISGMAPLHNPPAVNLIKACLQKYPHLPQVGVFDTAFHSTIPEYAKTYPIPKDIAEKWLQSPHEGQFRLVTPDAGAAKRTKELTQTFGVSGREIQINETITNLVKEYADDIVTDGIEGIVEEVGFRSTRIRTFYDSIITISNGELVNRSIDNKGKRRYRRLTTTLGLEYDTPPELIESFCEGIRQLILNHKWTRKDNFHVYFVNFGSSSLDIQLVVFWQTGDYAREQSEKHRLMIDILRIAKDMGVPLESLALHNNITNPNKCQ
jgi:hypothetical protein